MLLTIVVFIAILGVLILVHELGHFFAARIFKVKPEEFGFGYPPRIFGWVKDNLGKWKFIGPKDKAEGYDNTVWSLNWLPLGGFVKIKGEDANDQQEEDSFATRPIYQRFIILFAGVFMNFVLTFVLLSAGFISGIPSMVDDIPDESLNFSNPKIQIMSISPDSPAEQAEIKVGDVILEINNQPVTAISQVQALVSSNSAQPIDVLLLSGTQEITKQITPQAKLGEGDSAGIGVGLIKTATVKYPWYQAIYRGAATTASLTWTILKAFGNIIVDLFSTGKVTAEVAGPIGIAVLTGQVVSLGFIYILQFAALLSINLGIINLLPIPALDGGRILFLIIEKIKGRPVKQKLEAAIHQVGFMLLMVLIVLVTFKDFKTYGDKIWQAITSIF